MCLTEAATAELAEHLGSRFKRSAATIKRSVYFGSSMPLTEGLDVESTEFFTTVLAEDGQDVMRTYMETADATG